MDSADSTYTESFNRTRLLLGDGAMERLAHAHVVICGLGAVGSYATEALARAGIGRLTIADFDAICPSNINRQLYALHSTQGKPKVLVAKDRILDINPHCCVAAYQIMVHENTLPQICQPGPDYLIDATDALNPKVETLIYCRTHELAIISCMGAALRTDPTSIRIGPLETVHRCPLAMRVRKRLRRRGIPIDIPCVYSIESRAELAGKAIAAEQDSDPNYLDKGRKRRSLGSMPTIPGIFGLIAANEVILRLTESCRPR